MPVKDLVKQFESSMSPEGSPRTAPASRRHSATPPSSSPNTPSASGLPPPSPARFIHHPLLATRPLAPSRASPLPPRSRAAVRAQDTKERSNTAPPLSAATTKPTRADRPHNERSSDPVDKAEPRQYSAPTQHKATAGPTDSHGPDGLPRSSQMGSVSRMGAQITHEATHGERSKKTDAPRFSHPVATPVFKHKRAPSPIASSSKSFANDVKGDMGRLDDSRREDNWALPVSADSQRSPTSKKRVDPAPPVYSAFEEGSSSKPSASTVSLVRKSRNLDDIPMDILSRDTHDTHDNHALTPSRPPSPSATLVSHHTFAPHVPIAAKTVFSRGSAPLVLPPLDNYLASLPPPKFSSFPSRKPTSRNGKSSKAAMFPPLDCLATVGRTIEDLENNATVKPFWRNRDTIFGSLVNFIIGSMGSSAITNYYSLQGLYDGFQILALLLSTVVPHAGKDVNDKWRKLFLGTIYLTAIIVCNDGGTITLFQWKKKVQWIASQQSNEYSSPNILALNLGSTLLESFIFLVVLMALSGLLLYYFHSSTTRIAREYTREGLQDKDTTSGWGIVFASFTLTLIYLPLSTIAVHALLWSQDFWVVSNPYVNATSFPPDIPPLGPPSEFRDPLDFCYTTTMRRNEINFAPALVILSALTFTFLTVWFPIRLAKVISRAVPRVDRYTELGIRRSRVEMDHEYERSLHRDKNPFNFLYKDLRMQWGAYKSSYLFVKLSTLLIVALLDPYNCAFRNTNTNIVSIVRQAILVLAMFVFLLFQSFMAPFLDPVNNASEWISRAGYVAFAVLGFAAALKLPDNVKNALDGPILYIIYIINYGFTFYFLFINLGWSRRLIKKLFRRIDFSIDIFSPHLDISNTSRHTRRRIWQETISVLLLTGRDCAIPESQKMLFAESQESKWPPYLLNFQGTPAERHVENLKILREVGGLAYAKGIALQIGPCSGRMKRVQERIQRHFVGPDSYWKVPSQSGNNGGSFGNAWWIPFPPTLVMRYDSGELAVLSRLQELEEYIFQNEDGAVQEKRNTRMALRALDGLIVSWPYTHTQQIGSQTSWSWGRRYTAQTSTDYESCVLSITRRGLLPWKGVQLGSGFDVQLTYARDVHVDGGVIGLDIDFNLTPQLAKFLTLNRELIHRRLHRIDAAIGDYRRQTRRSMRAKCNSLTYEFLCTVYGSPKGPQQLAKIIMEQEKDPRAQQAFVEHVDALTTANERMVSVNRSEATAWWYLYWDDLWRRNYDTISALRTHAVDFNPHYPSSIAYRPLPRPALEIFLSQRGLFHKRGGHWDFIHSGVLNKLYFRLNQIVFRGSEKEIGLHLGDASFEVDIEELEFTSHPRTSSLGTGGGTDHDDVSIRARPFYRWETIYEDPLQHGAGGRHKRWLPKLAVWLGLSPFWKSGRSLTSGVSLDVQLEDGKYVLLEHAVDELKDKVD